MPKNVFDCIIMNMCLAQKLIPTVFCLFLNLFEMFCFYQLKGWKSNLRYVLFQVEKKLTKKKKKTVDSDIAFTKLVDKYKTTILSHTDKKKWYDNWRSVFDKYSIYWCTYGFLSYSIVVYLRTVCDL